MGVLLQRWTNWCNVENALNVAFKGEVNGLARDLVLTNRVALSSPNLQIGWKFLVGEITFFFTGY